MRTRGFTLIELLVVLAILAALSLVAVRSLTGLQDQGRFEQSQRAFEEVEEALLGSTSAWSEQAYVPGFLSDLGRLPAMASNDPGHLFDLRELWEKPQGIEPSHIAQDAVDPDVRLGVGWRGPYLRLPIGLDPSKGWPRDGYGNLLKIDTDDPMTHWAVFADNAGTPNGNGNDLRLVLLEAPNINRVLTEVAGTVTVTSEPGDESKWLVHVFAYAPDPTSGNLTKVEVTATSDPASRTPGPSPGPDPSPPDPSPKGPPFVFRYLFSGPKSLTPGIRVLRAYAFHTGKDARTDPQGKKSRVMTRVLIHGAQTIDFEVP